MNEILQQIQKVHQKAMHYININDKEQAIIFLKIYESLIIELRKTLI